MKFPLTAGLVLLSLQCWLALPLAAEPTRLALVIGNATYDGDAALRNPVNDAADVASALKKAGWQVRLVTNADRRALNSALDAWRESLASNPDSHAFFYYAGHGMQIDGENYLLPVRTPFDTASDIKHDALNLSSVTSVIEDSSVQVSVVVLDACRNNPFAKGGTRSAGGSRGLSVVKQAGGMKGSAIMFSTSPGDVAADGTGRNGVFTAALLNQIDGGLTLEDTFKKVTAEVRVLTGDKQKPWINASLGSDFYLLSDQIRQARAAEAAHLAAVEAQKAAAARQAEMEALAAKIRTAEAAKAQELERQLEASRREAEAARVAQAKADAQAAQLLASASRLHGKVRFESSVTGQVFSGQQLLGSVGPQSPLFADALLPGNQEFRFESNGGAETKRTEVGTAAYSTLFFGKLPEGGARFSSISLSLDPALVGDLTVRARLLSGEGSRLSAMELGLASSNPAYFDGDTVVLNSGVNVVTPGAWVLTAQHRLDNQESWFQVHEVPVGGDLSLYLSNVDYSKPYQLTQAKARKAALTQPLANARAAQFWLPVAGWTAVVPTTFLGIGTISSVFALPYTNSYSTVLVAGGLTAGLGTLAWWAFSSVPDQTLEREMKAVDQKIALLEPKKSSVTPVKPSPASPAPVAQAPSAGVSNARVVFNAPLSSNTSDPSLALVTVSQNAELPPLVLRARKVNESAQPAVSQALAKLDSLSFDPNLEVSSHFSGTEVSLVPGTQSLEPGVWLVSARLPGDVRDTWYQTLVVKPGLNQPVFVSGVEASPASQWNQLKTRREQISQRAQNAQVLKGFQDVYGPVAAGLGTMSAALTISYIGNPHVSGVYPAITGSLAAGLLGLAWWISSPLPDGDLIPELATIESQIQLLEPLVAAP